MNMMRKSVENAAIGVGVASIIGDLSAIHHPGCAAAIWRREMPAPVRERFAVMNPECLPSTRVILPPEAVWQTMMILCGGADPADAKAMDWLVEDVTALANCFANLMNPPYLRLRLEVITNNACRKFHIDSVVSRMICTYRGTGTQYGISTDGMDPKRVFTVPTGAPIILRGTQWPTDAPSGLLHRSPSILGTGETRLLLVIDPIFDPEDEI